MSTQTKKWLTSVSTFLLCLAVYFILCGIFNGIIYLIKFIPFLGKYIYNSIQQYDFIPVIIGVLGIYITLTAICETDSTKIIPLKILGCFLLIPNVIFLFVGDKYHLNNIYHIITALCCFYYASKLQEKNPTASLKHKFCSAKAKRKAQMNADSLLKICIDLITSYEKSNTKIKPSCLSDVLPHIQDIINEYAEELAEWEDDVDHVKVAHTMLTKITYNLLTSGKYHISYGILNPMNCSSNLMVVYNKCTDYSVSIHLIDEETKKFEHDTLLRRISQVG